MVEHLILRDACHGLTQFDQFLTSHGIAPNTLTRRLNALVESGLLERRRYSEHPPHVVGFVGQILVGDNQRVEAGQTLIRPDPENYRAAWQAANRQVAVLDTEIDAAKADVAQAEADLRTAPSWSHSCSPRHWSC
jgi:hypothetical protein